MDAKETVHFIGYSTLEELLAVHNPEEPLYFIKRVTTQEGNMGIGTKRFALVAQFLDEQNNVHFWKFRLGGV
jgi:hypothetical protein